MNECFSHFYNWHGIGMHFTLSILCTARSSEGGFCRTPESFRNQTVTSIPGLLPGPPTRADDSSGRHSHLSPRPLSSHGGSNVPGCQKALYPGLATISPVELWASACQEVMGPSKSTLCVVLETRRLMAWIRGPGQSDEWQNNTQGPSRPTHRRNSHYSSVLAANHPCTVALHAGEPLILTKIGGSCGQ